MTVVSRKLHSQRTRLAAMLLVASVISLPCVSHAQQLEQDRRQLAAVAWVNSHGGKVQFANPKMAAAIEVSLQGSKVTDLAPLSSLKSLEVLDLSDTEVKDLLPLATLTNLRRLNLSGTQVSDLSPLAGLKNLEQLQLSYTRVTDFPPLSKLTNLTVLALGKTPIQDLSPLSQLTKLTRIDLFGTQVKKLTPLKGLSSLSELFLGYTEVSDLSPLTGLLKLEKLRLNDTPVSNISHLATLIKLKQLDLTFTKVDQAQIRQLDETHPECKIGCFFAVGEEETVAWIKQLGGHVEYWNNPTDSRAQGSVRKVSLHNTKVKDISRLAMLGQTQEIHLQYTPLSDLSPLNGLKHLQVLQIDNTEVADLSPLVKFKELHTLYFSDTKIENLAVLPKLKKLQNLHLTYKRPSGESLNQSQEDFRNAIGKRHKERALIRRQLNTLYRGISRKVKPIKGHQKQTKEIKGQYREIIGLIKKTRKAEQPLLHEKIKNLALLVEQEEQDENLVLELKELALRYEVIIRAIEKEKDISRLPHKTRGVVIELRKTLPKCQVHLY